MRGERQRARMVLAFNKPYGVLSQFTDADNRPTLATYISAPGVYAAGRLDRDSEGLLILTDDNAIKTRITGERRYDKRYVVQVEGVPTVRQIARLEQSVTLKDGPTSATDVELLTRKPGWVWPRDPPIRVRRHQPTGWLALSVREGRNRMIRRLTAAVGLPTLRLIRTTVGPIGLDGLAPGQWRDVTDAFAEH